MVTALQSDIRKLFIDFLTFCASDYKSKKKYDLFFIFSNLSNYFQFAAHQLEPWLITDGLVYCLCNKVGNRFRDGTREGSSQNSEFFDR